MQQLREALKILAERVLILEHMIGVHGEEKNREQEKRRKMIFPDLEMIVSKEQVDILGKYTYLLFGGESDKKSNTTSNYV